MTKNSMQMMISLTLTFRMSKMLCLIRAAIPYYNPPPPSHNNSHMTITTTIHGAPALKQQQPLLRVVVLVHPPHHLLTLHKWKLSSTFIELNYDKSLNAPNWRLSLLERWHWNFQVKKKRHPKAICNSGIICMNWMRSWNKRQVQSKLLEIVSMKRCVKYHCNRSSTSSCTMSFSPNTPFFQYTKYTTSNNVCVDSGCWCWLFIPKHI